MVNELEKRDLIELVLRKRTLIIVSLLLAKTLNFGFLIGTGGVGVDSHPPQTPARHPTVRNITTSGRMSHSDRFYFASLKREDAPEIIWHLSNKAITKNLGPLPDPYTHADAIVWMDFLDAEAEEFPERARLRLYIREKGTEKVVGNISIWREEQRGVWVLGYWLAEELWGQGIMTWACSEVLKRAREQGVKNVVVGRIKEGNHGSRRVLEKNGFRHLGDQGLLLDGILQKEWEYEIEL